MVGTRRSASGVIGRDALPRVHPLVVAAQQRGPTNDHWNEA